MNIKRRAFDECRFLPLFLGTSTIYDDIVSSQLIIYNPQSVTKWYMGPPEKLKKLLEKGLITEEEAAAKRAKLLEDM